MNGVRVLLSRKFACNGSLTSISRSWNGKGSDSRSKKFYRVSSAMMTFSLYPNVSIRSTFIGSTIFVTGALVVRSGGGIVPPQTAGKKPMWASSRQLITVKGGTSGSRILIRLILGLVRHYGLGVHLS